MKRLKERVENLTVTEVEPGEEYHTIRCGSLGFGLDVKYNVRPEAGDEITLYSVRGSEVRGLDINGQHPRRKP